jgi:hypothetical protein
LVHDNGKPREIWGRKAVRPEVSGLAGYRIINKEISQVRLPGIFFVFSESARHQDKIDKKVPGIHIKKIINKERRDA